MNPVPPFIANTPDDTHCVNAVFRMVYKHFLNRDLTWKQIDVMTKAIPGKGTWTLIGDTQLAKRGLHVTNIEPVDYKALHRDGTDYLKKVFGEQTVAYYLNHSNIASVISDIPDFLRHVHYETRRASTDEIRTAVYNGKLVGVTVNSSVLNDRPGFALHYVLLYDFDGTNFHLHDPGLPPFPSRKITVQEFENSFIYPGGNGGIEIFCRKTEGIMEGKGVPGNAGQVHPGSTRR